MIWMQYNVIGTRIWGFAVGFWSLHCWGSSDSESFVVVELQRVTGCNQTPRGGDVLCLENDWFHILVTLGTRTCWVFGIFFILSLGTTTTSQLVADGCDHFVATMYGVCVYRIGRKTVSVGCRIKLANIDIYCCLFVQNLEIFNNSIWTMSILLDYGLTCSMPIFRTLKVSYFGGNTSMEVF